jgi:hypothetical protein
MLIRAKHGTISKKEHEELRHRSNRIRFVEGADRTQLRCWKRNEFSAENARKKFDIMASIGDSCSSLLRTIF